MKKMLVSIDDETVEALKIKAKGMYISMSALIRFMLKDSLAEQAKPTKEPQAKRSPGRPPLPPPVVTQDQRDYWAAQGMNPDSLRYEGSQLYMDNKAKPAAFVPPPSRKSWPLAEAKEQHARYVQECEEHDLDPKDLDGFIAMLKMEIEYSLDDL